MKLIEHKDRPASIRYQLIADNGGTIVATGPTPESVLSIVIEKARLAIANYSS